MKFASANFTDPAFFSVFSLGIWFLKGPARGTIRLATKITVTCFIRFLIILLAAVAVRHRIRSHTPIFGGLCEYWVVMSEFMLVGFAFHVDVENFISFFESLDFLIHQGDVLKCTQLFSV